MKTLISKNQLIKLLLCSSIVAITSCLSSEKKDINNSANKVSNNSISLPSWNDGKTKEAIINFLNIISDSTNEEFIPVEDRIATFDNDGTLWSEQPVYFQFFFAIDQIKALHKDHPEWSNTHPYNIVLEEGIAGISKLNTEELVSLVLNTHTNNTTVEFDSIVTQWIKNAKHPRFNKPFTDLVYQPMLELLDLLRAYDFKVYIVSGGGIEFMRPWAEEVYNIPKSQVIGSSVLTAYQYNNGNPQIVRLPAIDFIDDKEGKPEAINKHIGRKPVFAVGNSDGDLQMLRWTDSNKHKTLKLYIHHTDSTREWAYDRNSHIGKLNVGLDEGLDKKWTFVDMQKDWKLIYPFEK